MSGNLIFVGLIVAVVLLMVFAELSDRRHHRRRLQQQEEKIRRRVAELRAAKAAGQPGSRTHAREAEKAPGATPD